jgi:hypothetical protein
MWRYSTRIRVYFRDFRSGQASYDVSGDDRGEGRVFSGEFDFCHLTVILYKPVSRQGFAAFSCLILSVSARHGCRYGFGFSFTGACYFVLVTATAFPFISGLE